MGSVRAIGDPSPKRLALRPWDHKGLRRLGLVMDSVTRENSLKIASSLGRSDCAGSWFYALEKVIAEGRPDPLAELNVFLT